MRNNRSKDLVFPLPHVPASSCTLLQVDTGGEGQGVTINEESALADMGILLDLSTSMYILCVYISGGRHGYGKSIS